jgi:catechol 2,3-dioxygenase-like lactoylglutathione lyase family enzyme
MRDAVSIPPLAGMHHVKIPVTDLARSREWYERVFHLQVEWEFPDENGTLRGLAGTIPGLGNSLLALRENRAAAEGARGFDLVGLGVDDRQAIEQWAAYLDTLGIPHSPVIDASDGWLLVFHDPDGIELHLYSWEQHGIDQTGRSGYGRRVHD